MKKLISTISKQRKVRPSICRIHVARADLRDNIKNNTDNPIIGVHRRGRNLRGNLVIIYDKLGNEVARIVQNISNPLKCGARVWIETHGTVMLAYNEGGTVRSEVLES